MTERLDLDGELTIVTAADTAALLRPFLAGEKQLELGLDGVTDFDTAGLQLLLYARAEAARLGAVLTLGPPSPAVAAVLELAALTELAG